MESKSLGQILASQGTPVVLDGGLATELERHGCNISGSLWSAEILINQPEMIERVHLDYFNAGADVAITASYQASIAGLMEHQSGMTAKNAEELIRRSVQLARNAANSVREQDASRQLFVAGSVGPYGAYLADGSEYRGDYSLPKLEMMDFHRPRVRALVDGGVDVLAFETIPSLPEALALINLLHEFPQVDAWISFTLRDEDTISDGTPLQEMVECLASEEQVLAIGVNCIPEALAEGALTKLHKLTKLPLVVYPNSGETYDADSKSWTGERSGGALLKDRARRWRDLGARLIGGCCRTTPDSIRMLRESLRSN